MRLACLLFVVAAGLGGGCGTRATKGTAGAATRQAVEDPWPAAAAAVRKELTPGGIGRVLGDLTSASTVEPKFSPDALPPADEPALKAVARLTDDDLKGLRSPGYSGLDPHHINECLYLRDAARTLELDGLPPAEQAGRAFAWVCRQVVLQPWVGTDRSTGGVTAYPPVPPGYVLRRGSGSGLERAYVMLALGRQLGLDVILIGPPDAADAGWQFDPAGKSDQPPRGPFWAVGVRDAAEVRLFDPWRGEPFAGPDGKGNLTLAEAVGNPDLARLAGVPAERVKASVPFLAASLPSLAPRLKRLEAELKADAGVRLFVDLPAAVKGFADATKTAAKVWNPPADPWAFGRVLGGFVPPADGGNAPDPTLLDKYRISQLPPGVIRFGFAPGLLPDPANPADLGAPDAVTLLQTESVNRVGGQFLLDPTPRERLQRGQPEAVRALVGLRDEYAKAQERVRTDRDREALVRQWVTQARERSRVVAVARDRNPAALVTAEGEFQKFWQDTRVAWQVLVDLAVAETGVTEATFLLALAKHEQAVREQGRADRQPADDSRRRAADAWAEARGWWDRCLPLLEAGKGSSARAAHARRLADRAAGGG